MYTSEKTDRVIWQVTDTMGVPILGRTQAKHMNYISYPEIHAPLGQGQSQVHRLCTQSRDYKQQSTVYKDCAVYRQSQDYIHNHPGCPKKSTELQPEQNQAQHMNLSLHKPLGARVQ